MPSDSMVANGKGVALALLLAAVAIPSPAGAQGISDPLAVDLQFPLGLALLPGEALYVSERRGHRVLRLDLESGVVSVAAGTGTRGFSGDGGPAPEAELACPDAIDLDSRGNLFIADRCNERIRKVDARSGIIETIAGTGSRGTAPDGAGLEMPFMGIYYVEVEGDSVVLFTETDAHRIRVLELATGMVRTVAGSGVGGFGGDGGPALEADLARPHVALYARNGDLIIGDSFNQRIRRVDARNGIVRTIAGNGEQGVAEDGALALESPSAFFGSIHELDDGDLVFTEWINGRLVRLDVDDGTLHVLAGNTSNPSRWRDGFAPRSTFFGPLADFAIDADGRYFVVAAESGAVRVIDFEAGEVTTVLGRLRAPGN